jgi:OFA family oxalate/formate antiporter-like MFS transporter
VHLVPYATDHGIAPASAALLVSAIGIGSALGRFLRGGLADRLGRELSLVATFAGMALALFAWALSTGFWPLAGFALVFGIAYGGWVALFPAVVFRRPQYRRPHPHSVHQRRLRHFDRSGCGRLRL